MSYRLGEVNQGSLVHKCGVLLVAFGVRADPGFTGRLLIIDSGCRRSWLLELEQTQGLLVDY